MQEVVGLQQHVAELRVGDPLIAPLEPGLHRLLRHHLVHGEVLADVAQEVEDPQFPQPLTVVDQEAPSAGEVDEALELAAHGPEVRLQLLAREERALRRLAPGVADHARAAAGEHDGAVARLLEAPQGAQLHQVPHLQARLRRVEARIDSDGLGRQQRGERVAIGDLVEQAPPFELREHVVRLV